MYEKGVLTISEWYKGQTKHPISGFGLLQNVEVFENLGIAKLTNKSTATSYTELPIASVKDSSGNVYVLTGITGAGKLYKNGVAVRTGLANAWDMVIWKNYVIVRHGDSLSAFGPITGVSAFTSFRTGLNNGYYGKLVVGQDDILYFGNGNSVGSLSEATTFDPTNSGTYTVNTSALDLPEGQFITTMVEYGRNLAIGTSGGSNYYDRQNANNARIYFWDRISSSFTLPVIFNENSLEAIIQHANKLFVVAGTQGNVYVSDGTNYVKVATIPYLDNSFYGVASVYPNSLTISTTGNLLVGVSTGNYPTSKAGIYEVNLNDKYQVCFKKTISTGSTGSNSQVLIGFIRQQSYQNLIFGWGDNAVYGTDTSSSNLVSNYGGVIESPLVKVGSNLNKKSFNNLEFVMAKPFVSGQNVRISYRKNLTDSYTTIGTFGFSINGSVVSVTAPATISESEFIQIKIELDQAEATLYGSNVELIAVSLW